MVIRRFKFIDVIKWLLHRKYFIVLSTDQQLKALHTMNMRMTNYLFKISPKTSGIIFLPFIFEHHVYNIKISLVLLSSYFCRVTKEF